MLHVFVKIKCLVVSLESLDQLTEWAVDKFKDIRNKSIDPPSFPGHPLTKNELMVCCTALKCKKRYLPCCNIF